MCNAIRVSGRSAVKLRFMTCGDRTWIYIVMAREYLETERSICRWHVRRPDSGFIWITRRGRERTRDGFDTETKPGGVTVTHPQTCAARDSRAPLMSLRVAATTTALSSHRHVD